MSAALPPPGDDGDVSGTALLLIMLCIGYLLGALAVLGALRRSS